ncbi:hypothetical protein SDC9_184812 [bioreactor metagenome]|uniref:Uncharacterized protein n=1 Tax=bioreactor metagenome TaxID=1076179 RepID=A0A645HFF0_9ZZZZ
MRQVLGDVIAGGASFNHLFTHAVEVGVIRNHHGLHIEVLPRVRDKIGRTAGLCSLLEVLKLLSAVHGEDEHRLIFCHAHLGRITDDHRHVVETTRHIVDQYIV